MEDITIVFMGVINQHSHHWGAPSCIKLSKFLNLAIGWWKKNTESGALVWIIATVQSSAAFIPYLSNRVLKKIID